MHRPLIASAPRRERANRHTACDLCRRRKVKCDGRQPYCKRCANGGVAWECSYSAYAGQRKKQKSSSSSESPPTFDGAEIITDYRDHFTSNVPLFASVPYEVSSNMLINSEALIGPPAADIFSLQDPPGSCSIYSSYSSAISTDFQNNNATSISLCRLFSNQNRMRNSLDKFSNDRFAVRYAICALAVTASPQSYVWIISDPSATTHPSNYSSIFYHAAKNTLQQETQMQTSQVPSLQELQATILLGLYELHRGDFGHAWVTASRAVWISQALQLHILDSRHTISSVNSADLEDARMAFWATMGLAGFISLGGRAIDSINIVEISTVLPRPPVDRFLSTAGVTILRVFQKAVSRPLTVEEGICAAKVLFPRIVSHVKTASQEEDPGCQPYNFWTNHHKLHHLISHIFNGTESENKSKLVLDVALNAMLVVLHEALIRKMFTATQLRSDELRNAEEAALQQSLQIVNIIETGVLSQDSWARVAVPWAAYVALQSLQQRQKRTSWRNVHEMEGQVINTLDGFENEVISPFTETFRPPDPALQVDALVLDSVNALRSALLDWSNEIPLARFLSPQIDAGSGDLEYHHGECLVGLIDFTASFAVT
ncbi:uncharacterized protein N7479_007363 [Penicillium vulpinum]|uniref:uncharacterized protein n=1 Tax=Penicillium vulpinum TaxID=29845 RepID=UPI002547FE6B|nr:uncharacterized protein N7479_007363 [Penicillium vulpinum]KAJ5960213.1 hypothetical protein N7479_007363 [Penicillium vulpinum]